MLRKMQWNVKLSPKKCGAGEGAALENHQFATVLDGISRREIARNVNDW